MIDMSVRATAQSRRHAAKREVTRLPALERVGRVRRPSPSRQSTVVDLFCGAGGLTHGFVLEGIQVSAGVDIDDACRYPYETNNGAPFVCKDVETLTASQVRRLFGAGSVRILVACAPCQPFSTYNQGNEDPNWRLLGSLGRLIEEVKPEVVSIENVPRLVTFREGRVFRGFLASLRRTGYDVSWGVLYGPDFGLAQTRSRLVLMASRLGPIDLPKPTHRYRHRTVRQEIGGLPVLGHGQVDAIDPLHRASRLSETNLRRITASKPGGTWRDWADDLVASCHKATTGDGYSSVYGRMDWSRPAPTITTQFYGFGSGRFGHPQQNRALSLREGALLQGFPKDYAFCEPGKRVEFTTVGRLIGNAVPVRLSSAIARAVKRHLAQYVDDD